MGLGLDYELRGSDGNERGEMVNGVVVLRLADEWPISAAVVGLSDVLALVVEQGWKLSRVGWGADGISADSNLRWPPL